MKPREKLNTCKRLCKHLVISPYVVISVMLRALLRHDSNLYYPTLLNKHALHLEFRTLEVLECAVPLGWERACVWGGLRALDFGI